MKYISQKHVTDQKCKHFDTEKRFFIKQLQK